MARQGVVHGTGDDAHQLAIDPVPRVFTAEQWTQLEDALGGRSNPAYHGRMAERGSG